MGQEQNSTQTLKWKQLTESERYKIEALFQSGLTPIEIGRQIDRDRRTIERELKRGRTQRKRLNRNSSKSVNEPLYIVDNVYYADVGQRIHNERASNKGRTWKIGHNHKLSAHIERKICDERYSPDAVIGEIKTKGLSFDVTVCTKTVYNMIDAGLFLRLSNKDLPVKRNGKKRKYRQTRSVALNNTKGRSIEERPPEVENREEYGHWEMDCVVGKGKACLLVMTERKSRQQLLFKIAAKTQHCVHAVINKLERRYKSRFKQIFRSITMDNGSEFLDMEGIENSVLNVGTKRTICYYAHPYSAYERGSNENANKLIRRFIPKGSDIGKLSFADVKRIEHWINCYPRRIFGYKTANEIAA